MSKVKITEKAREIYWATTHQGEVEIEGRRIQYRYGEDSNGNSLYIYDDGVWTEKDPDKDPAYAIIYDMCTETHPSDFEEGDIIE
jgi:hypothetical protein